MSQQLVKDPLDVIRAKLPVGSEILAADADCIEISQHVPHSFWDRRGAYWAARKLLSRGIPQLQGAKFVTLTVNRKDDQGRERWAGPEECFEELQKQPAYSVQWLRNHGYQVDAYIVKLELHEDGWPHWHLLLWCDQKIHFRDLNASWVYGYTHIERVYGKDDGESAIWYALKYAMKSGEPPEWVRNRGRVQVCRKSHGFYEALERKGHKFDPFPSPSEHREIVKKKASTCATIGERMERWARMGKVRMRLGGRVTHRTLRLKDIFFRVFRTLEMNQDKQRIKRYTTKPSTLITRNRIDYEILARAIGRKEEQYREPDPRRTYFEWNGRECYLA